jgi:hypothetical protein
MGCRRGVRMSRPPIRAAVAGTRGYDRAFDWGYADDEPVEPGGPGAPGGLIPIIFGGVWLNTGDQAGGLCSVITGVDGWLDSPPVNGNDVERVISDGAAWGPKVLNARTIVLRGAAAGPRDQLGRFRDQLAALAASREPVELVIGDYDLARVLTADVRAGTEAYRHTPLGRDGFRWQMTVTAADPMLYSGRWESANLTNLAADEVTGREYPREYPWRYGQPLVPNSALLRNDGNADAPVYALYTGDLSESTLTTARGGSIRVVALDAGVAILVNTATLTAESPQGGHSRASFLLPGSRPMTVPAGSSARWNLRAAGRGSVQLAWRSAWV